ncbi:MAG: efflux RND transporter periplasmic adaptor subunit, partial [Acidobacteriota bacterium]
MKNRIGIVLIMICLCILVCSCSERHTRRNNNPPEGTENAVDSPAGPQGRGMGRGLQRGGRYGFGRRAVAGGPSADIVILTEDEIKAIDVQTFVVRLMPLRAQLNAMGKVLENQYRKAIVSYAFSARIAERHVRVGDWVKKDQRLITLQSEEVGNAKSEFYKAGADFELAKMNYERVKRLLDRGVGARKDFLTAEAEFKVAEANLNAAEKKLHVLGFNEEQVDEIADSHQVNPVITLFSPIAGKVIADNVVLGEMIDQSTEILTIMDPRVLHIDADIYEKDIAKMTNGLEVEVTVPAYPGEIFKGNIFYISDILNPDTRTITVRTEVENRGFKLKPGMFADMMIYLNNVAEVLVVPAEAVLDDQNDRFVFLAKDDHYMPVVIQI